MQKLNELLKKIKNFGYSSDSKPILENFATGKNNSIFYPKTMTRPENEMMAPVYVPVEDENLLMESFIDLNKSLFDRLEDEQKPANGGYHFLEMGQMADLRRYFFIQPYGELGWLFEISPSGWIISLASKVASRDLIIRHGDALDIGVVYGSKGSLMSETRISSPTLFGSELVSSDVYKDTILKKLTARTAWLKAAAQT